MALPSLLLDIAVVVQFLHLADGLLHHSFDELVISTGIDLIDPVSQMLTFRSDVLTGEAASQQTHHGMADAGRAADGAAAAADAVKALLCTLFQFATLGIGDVLHDIQALRASLGAGITADTGVHR